MTLVETAVVITVIGLLLGLITSVTIRILRAESITRNHAAQLYARSQLADQFRADIHAATVVVVPQEAKGSTLTIDPETDRTVEYTVESDQVRRTVRSAATVRSQNAFRLPEDATATFATFAIEDVVFARIRIEQGAAVRHLLEGTAQVDRHRKFLERRPP
jgi:type II secretory pathway pseudopilin PulG